MEKKVVVFGSYVSDLTAKCGRFPVAGETVRGSTFKIGPGGKGSNQAVAAHRAGARVTLVTKVGKDSFGDMAKVFYAENGMTVEGVLTDETYPSGAALIMVHEETTQNEIVVIPGACEHITDEDLAAVSPILEGAEIVLTQLETNRDANFRVLREAHERGCLTILNPAPAVPLTDAELSSVDIITPNETEASLLTGVAIGDDPADVRKAAEILRARGVGTVIITLGEKGSYCLNNETEFFCDSMHLGEAVDTTGAGDAYNGGLAAALSFGYGLYDAVRYATVVAGLSVTKFGTAPAMPTLEEIRKHFA